MYSPFESLILIGIYPCEECQGKKDIHYDFIAWEREKYKWPLTENCLNKLWWRN